MVVPKHSRVVGKVRNGAVAADPSIEIGDVDLVAHGDGVFLDINCEGALLEVDGLVVGALPPGDPVIVEVVRDGLVLVV